MRTGELWAITKHGIQPDIMVTGKGLSGGVYPIAAVLLSERAGAWLKEDGFGHTSTFGGAELGCIAALKTLEITRRPEVRSMVHYISDFVGTGIRQIQANHPDWFIGIRQHGVVLGLEFNHPEGAKYVMRELYNLGVWAIFSTLAPTGAAVQTRDLDDPSVVRGASRPHRAGHRPRRVRGPQARTEGQLMTEQNIDVSVAQAGHMLERATWAAASSRNLRPRARDAYRHSGR